MVAKQIIITISLVSTIIIFIILIWFSECIWPNVTEVLIGLLSSFVAILLIEIPIFFMERNRYSYLKHNYVRIAIYDYNYEAKSYEDQIALHKENKVNIEKKGENRFALTLYYRNLEEATYDIIMDSNNPTYGQGTYQYSNRDNKNLDIGTATLMKDQSNNSRIILFHDNKVPSNATKGYEILERKVVRSYGRGERV